MSNTNNTNNINNSNSNLELLNKVEEGNTNRVFLRQNYLGGNDLALVEFFNNNPLEFFSVQTQLAVKSLDDLENILKGGKREVNQQSFINIREEVLSNYSNAILEMVKLELVARGFKSTQEVKNKEVDDTLVNLNNFTSIINVNDTNSSNTTKVSNNVVPDMTEFLPRRKYCSNCNKDLSALLAFKLTADDIIYNKVVSIECPVCKVVNNFRYDYSNKIGKDS